MKGTYVGYRNLKKIKGSKTKIDEGDEEDRNSDNNCDQCGFDCGQQDNRRHY
jgi:hypothetical protein